MPLRVEIDALVLTKIQKHCRETLPIQSTGVLLGFDVSREDTVLQVTNSFASVSYASDEVPDAAKLDGNVVGWYACRTGDSYLADAALLESQYGYQKDIPTSVVIVYDPEAYSAGQLPFKFLQITEDFMKFRAAAYESKLPLDLSSWPVGAPFLQEVEFEVANSVLVDAFVVNYLLQDKSTVDVIESRVAETRVEAAAEFLTNQLHAVSHQLDIIEEQQKAVVNMAKRAAQSGGRDLKRNRDDLAFECGAQSLETMTVAQQTSQVALNLQKAAVVAKQCLAKLN